MSLCSKNYLILRKPKQQQRDRLLKQPYNMSTDDPCAGRIRTQDPVIVSPVCYLIRGMGLGQRCTKLWSFLLINSNLIVLVWFGTSRPKWDRLPYLSHQAASCFPFHRVTAKIIYQSHQGQMKCSVHCLIVMETGPLLAYIFRVVVRSRARVVWSWSNPGVSGPMRIRLLK